MKRFTTISMTLVLHIYCLEKKSAECFHCGDEDEDGDDYDEVCTCN